MIEKVRIDDKIFDDFLNEIGWIEKMGDLGTFWPSIPEFEPVRDVKFANNGALGIDSIMVKDSIRVYKMWWKLRIEDDRESRPK